VFENALSGLLFFQKSHQGWRKLESIHRSKYGKICALPCHRLIREGTYFKSTDKALAHLNGRSLVLEGNQPFVKPAYFFG